MCNCCEGNCKDSCECKGGDFFPSFSDVAELTKNNAYEIYEYRYGFKALGKRLRERELQKVVNVASIFTMTGCTPYGKIEYSVLPEMAALQDGDRAVPVGGVVWKCQLKWLDDAGKVYDSKTYIFYDYDETAVEFIATICERGRVAMVQYYNDYIKPTIARVKAKREQTGAKQ